MASKAERLRKAYEFKLGADLAAKLTDSQLKILSAYYNSLSESEQSDIDSNIAAGRSNDLTEMARAMAEENAEGPPESEMEPDAPSSSISLYEGTRETDLVTEEIDETILRALGLEDVFDIDYGTYKTLIKEKMMADRMGQKMDSGEAQAVTEEFRRIKGKVGRFRINKKKISTGNIKSPVRNRNQNSGGGMKNFLALKGDTQEAPAQAEPTEKFTKTNSILDEILSTIQNLFKFEQNRDAKNQRDADRRRKQGREDKLESGSSIGKGLKKAAAAILKPIQGPLEYLINFLKYTFLTYIVKNLFKWFQNPDNQKKLESIGRFLKDWWPALVTAYLLFGNRFSGAIRLLGKILIKGTAKLLKVAIPKLLSLIARNPKAAAAAALFTAGATVPMLFPDTVNEQERKITEKPGSNEDKIKQLKEQKANLNPLQQMQGVGAEIDEQIFKLETGETKSYNEGGAVEGEQTDPKELDMSKFLPFLGPLGLLMGKGKDVVEGVVDGVEKDPKMLLALGPMAFPVMAMLEQRKKKQSTASNQDKKDPARDITTESGTDVTGAGSDTQLVPAKPGEIVINKETVDAVGAETFDKISTNSGKKIMGAGPDTQMIAARPGEVIINKETVAHLGAGYFLGLNKKYGGSNANKPKTAKVQAAMGGGFVLPTFQGGGMVGGPSMVEVPTFVDKQASDYDEGEETPNVRTPSPDGEEEKKEQKQIASSGGGGDLNPGDTAESRFNDLMKSTDPQRIADYDSKHGKGAYAAKLKQKLADTYSTDSPIKAVEPQSEIIPTGKSVMESGSFGLPPGVSGLSGGGGATNVLTEQAKSRSIGAVFGDIFGAFRKKEIDPQTILEDVKSEAKNMATSMGGTIVDSNSQEQNMKRVMSLPPDLRKSVLADMKRSGEVKENTGMDIPGATADRQHIDAQPGEYVVPKKSVGALGGPEALDKVVAQTDKNSTPAKLMPASKKPVPGPPVPEGTASMQTLPAITGGSTGGGGKQGSSTERQVPTLSATSPYTGDRQNNADIYGIR